jgi:hypothetical protein
MHNGFETLASTLLLVLRAGKVFMCASEDVEKQLVAVGVNLAFEVLG